MLRAAFNIAAILSLVLFCAVIALWVRAQWVSDRIKYLSDTRHYINVCSDGVRWIYISTDSGDESGFSWITADADSVPPLEILGLTMQWDLLGVQKATNRGMPIYVGEEILAWIIPYWIPMVYAFVLPGLRGWLWWRAWLERKRAGPYACSKCGYDLRATPDACPECGWKRA